MTAYRQATGGAVPLQRKACYDQRSEFRGSGFGKLMLDHLADHARAHHIRLLRLETGIHQREAIGLYERAGFYRIPPFGPYTDDPLSPCYEKPLP